MASRERGWWLDRRIPISLLVVVLIQFGSIIWWASGKEQQDRFQDTRLGQSEMLLNRYGGQQELIIERLARIETRLESQTELLKDMKKHWERR